MIVKIFRYTPETNKPPHYDNYKVDTRGKTFTIKDLLEFIAKEFDPSLSFMQHSICNHAFCKRCYVKVQGQPVLACNTVVKDQEEIQIDPINQNQVVKDLVVKNL